jgi:LacI family transcriptional regulator
MQSLLRGRSYTVGLISTDRYGRFSIPLLEGIEDALSPGDISVFLCDARDDPARERKHIDSLLAKQVDGIIVTGRRTDTRQPIDVGASDIPVLYAFAQVMDPQAVCLVPDDVQGARLVTDHLFMLGRRHFAYITGPRRFAAARLREQGIRESLTLHGVAFGDHRIYEGQWTEASGYQAALKVAALKLVEKNRQTDAIICGADLIARGVVDALRDVGVRVPDDIAVVGFDNWEIIAEGTRPPLTSVDMNLHELGQVAGEQLSAMIEGHTVTGTRQLPCRLVVRESCGATRRKNEPESPTVRDPSVRSEAKGGDGDRSI